MSIIFCTRHSLRWDSDFKSQCPACENQCPCDGEKFVDPACMAAGECTRAIIDTSE